MNCICFASTYSATPDFNLSKCTISHPHEVASREGLHVAGDCGRHERTPKFFPVIVSNSTAKLVVNDLERQPQKGEAARNRYAAMSNLKSITYAVALSGHDTDFIRFCCIPRYCLTG